MEDYIEQYTPLAIEMGTNVLLALAILIVGSWVGSTGRQTCRWHWRSE